MEKVLVVDDELEIREIVTSMLAAAGYECQQATSGKEALTLFDEGAQFNLVLCDLIMPELDGISLLEQIQKRSSGTPFVMLTAIRDISVALLAIRRGAYDYLIKPFDREQLLATVRRAVADRRLKLENRVYQNNRREALAENADVEDLAVEAFGDRLAMKDPASAAHSRRVTAFSIARYGCSSR
jgi:cyclic di-GMP phosphodiesterase